MVWAGIVLTTALALGGGAPNVIMLGADTAGLDLWGWGDYEYNLYISHAITDCKWWPPHSVKVLTETQFSRQAFAWSDYNLSTPDSGDIACIWWDTQPEPSVIYFGIRRRRIKQRTYLPLVTRDV